MVLELHKSEPKIWKRLFLAKKKPRNLNMTIWWDLREAHREDMEEFSRLLEEDEDDEDAVSPKSKYLGALGFQKGQKRGRGKRRRIGR